MPGFDTLVTLLLTHGFMGFLIIVLIAQWYFIQKWVRESLNGDRIKKDRLTEVKQDAKDEINRNTASYKEIAIVKDGQIAMLTGLLEDVKASRDELEKSLYSVTEQLYKENKHVKHSIADAQNRVENDNSNKGG